MNPEQSAIFEHDPFAIPRRSMIPKWIRFFAWIFAVLTSFAVLAFIWALLSGKVATWTLYGFTNANAGPFMILVLFVWILKGLTALGLLTEKDWAIKAAMADAAVGIALCILSMIILPWSTTTTGIYGGYTTHYNLRIELLLLVPYLAKMWKIRQQWEENAFARNNIAP